MTDNTPTERFSPVTAPSTTAAVGAEDSSRRPLIILISVAGALLLAVIVLMIVLFTRGGDAPFVVPTDSSTPTASESTTPTAAATSASPSPAPEVTKTEEAAPPPPTGPIQSFTASTTSVKCDGVNSVPLHFEWAADGVSLWFGVGVNDAKAAPYGQYELTDELDIDYQCGQANKQQKYTISVQTGAGDTVSQSITITE